MNLLLLLLVVVDVCMYALLYSVFVCFSANLMKHPNVGHAYEMIRVCFQVVPKAEKLLT